MLSRFVGSPLVLCSSCSMGPDVNCSRLALKTLRWLCDTGFDGFPSSGTRALPSGALSRRDVRALECDCQRTACISEPVTSPLCAKAEAGTSISVPALVLGSIDVMPGTSTCAFFNWSVLFSSRPRCESRESRARRVLSRWIKSDRDHRRAGHALVERAARLHQVIDDE